ncbi:hypothetical protein DPMN_024529 [Dreissena polymorpha]|uniref:Nucleolar protein 11 N-terminal domain-containing protein n=1 Tax=Dreissena polymorpha TaxID=45954 RepID=A0A9D4LRK9_DREPO|nr:hypothetical protein DPMN_024529 [Dreissena polymorpha]
MAAPMDSIAFCKIVNEPSFVSVKPGFNESSIIVSSKGKSCDVYALADQKLVKSWSLRHGIKISSPVLWDSQKEKFFCVSNNQDVHTWNKDTPDFDKSKKRHSSTQIHELMLTGENEPVILYCNGVVDFVTNIKTDHSDGPLKPLEQILWSQVASLDSRLVVLFVANCEAGYKLYRVCYEHDSWQSVCSDIPKPTEESSLISVDSYTTDTFVTATFLWLNGKLTQTTVQGDTVRHTSLSHTIRGCEGDSVAMVGLDEIHVAFAGITRGSESTCNS